MTSEKINERIGQLRLELAALQSMHDRMVYENTQGQQLFGQRVIQNQTRFAQINGAITELTLLLNNEQPILDNSDLSHSRPSQPGAPFDRFPGADSGSGNNLGDTVGDRIVDSPNTSPG